MGTYTTAVEVDEPFLGGAAVLDLGDVGDLARVRVNDTDCGVTWTAPWRVDVTGALRPGRNRIEIDVANAWMNRLIAEASRPTGEIFPPDSPALHLTRRGSEPWGPGPINAGDVAHHIS